MRTWENLTAKKFLAIAHRFPLLLAIILSMRVADIAWAHPADMYFHSYTIELTPSGINIDWSFSPGIILVRSIWADVDRNTDEEISPEEANAWLEKRTPEFTSFIDNTPLEWEIVSIDWPRSLTNFEIGDETILVHLSANWPLDLAGNHQLLLHNQYAESTSINWFTLHGTAGVSFQKPYQERCLLRIDFKIPQEAELDSGTQAAPETGLITYWDSGTPALPALAIVAPTTDNSTETDPQPTQEGRPSTILTDLVRIPEISVTVWLSSFAIALVLGSLHALTPGHGKALVAAYLVGSRGTFRHAIVLGGIVTLTHTGSVVALGALTLIASRFIVPTDLFPIMEFLSGLVIVAIGVHLIRRGWRGFQAVMRARRREKRPRTPTKGKRVLEIHEAIPVRGYDDLLPKGDFSFTQFDWRSLIALGFSGGLVPCPDAIAILLVAIAINRIPLGLSLIIAFSSGLALVLIGIGIALVRSRTLLEKLSFFSRLTHVVPLLSAVVVIGLGLGLTYNAVQNSNLLEMLAQPRESVELSQRPGSDSERVLFLTWDEEGKNQLYIVPLAGGEPLQLTREPLGIFDYTLSPDGNKIVYASFQEDLRSALWEITIAGTEQRQLVACPDSICNGAIWSPDNTHLVYQKLLSTESNVTGLTTLWWLDSSTGENNPVFQDAGFPGYFPRWSHDGQWLSYIAPGIPSQVVIYNVIDGRRHSIPAQSGAPVSWHPNDEILLINNIRVQDNMSVLYLCRYELESEELLDISGQEIVLDHSPTWSPDGKWIALVRTDLSRSPGSRGDHIWLMQPDGNQAHPITSGGDLFHGQPVWSPDGRYLLFHQYLLTEKSISPSIWLFDIETGEQRKVVDTGIEPSWVHGKKPGYP